MGLTDRASEASYRPVGAPKVHFTQDGRPLCGNFTGETSTAIEWESVTCLNCIAVHSRVAVSVDDVETVYNAVRAAGVPVRYIDLQKSTGLPYERVRQVIKRLIRNHRLTEHIDPKGRRTWTTPRPTLVAEDR